MPGTTPEAKGRSGPMAARNGPDSLFDKPRSRAPKRRRSRAGRKDGRHPRAAVSYLRLPWLVLPGFGDRAPRAFVARGAETCVVRRAPGAGRFRPVGSPRGARPRSYGSSRTLDPKLSVFLQNSGFQRGGAGRDFLGGGSGDDLLIGGDGREYQIRGGGGDGRKP